MKKFSVFVLALLFFVCLSLLGTCTALQANKPVETKDVNNDYWTSRLSAQIPLTINVGVT